MFAFSFFFAAFAAAICCRSAAEDELDEFEAVCLEADGEGALFCLAGFVSAAWSRSDPAVTAGPKASDSAGRGFDGLPPTVLLPVILPVAAPFVRVADIAALLDGEGDRGTGGISSCVANGFEALGSRLLVRGVKPKPPRDVLAAGLALDEVGLALDVALPTALAKEPSLVPGLLLRSLPFLLRLEAGLGGGPIGLSTGEKKLDLLLSLGVVGTFCRLSIVRSLSEGLDPFRSFGLES